jgi:hypothetical protein
MTDLSPQAQAVLDAFASQMEGGWISPEFIPYEARKIAAALEAAADQPYEVPPWHRGDDYWTYRNGADAERNRLLAIAAELRGQDQPHTGQED